MHREAPFAFGMQLVRRGALKYKLPTLFTSASDGNGLVVGWIDWAGESLVRVPPLQGNIKNEEGGSKLGSGLAKAFYCVLLAHEVSFFAWMAD